MLIVINDGIWLLIYLNPWLLYKRLTKWIHVGISLSASKKSWPTSWSKKRRFSSCPFCSAESTKMPVKIFLGVKSDANSLKELFGCSTYYYFARLEASLIETDIFHAPLKNFELRSFSLFQSGFVWTYGSHAAYGTPKSHVSLLHLLQLPLFLGSITQQVSSQTNHKYPGK